MREYCKAFLRNLSQDIFFHQILELGSYMSGNDIEHLLHNQPLFQFLTWNKGFEGYSKVTMLHLVPLYRLVWAQELWIINVEFFLKLASLDL